jgi:hypothetical protein
MKTQSSAQEAQTGLILKFWRHILGGQAGLLEVWTGIRDENDDIPKKTIKQQRFNYPKAAQSAATWALEKAEEGREVYFCAHLLREAQRIKENASEVISLWGEYDGESVPNGELKPSATVESSPGHYHCYWRLTDPIPPEIAELFNKRIAHATGADPSGFDLTQLLRVPGTPNNKYPGRPLVELKDLDPTRARTPAELDELLPPLEEPQVKYESEGSDEEPPVVLNPTALRVWHGEALKLKDNGEIDRSASLMKIGRVLFDAGANRAVIERALEERDRTLGWKKYTGRRDAAERYSEIVDELEENGRNHKIRATFGESTNVPKIQVNNRHLRDVTTDALEALRLANNPPEVFVRAGSLVRVREDEHGTPQIQLMELNHIRGRLARVADFVRVGKQGNSWVETKVNPPEIVVKDLMALSKWPFPPLEAVVESPILRPDGSIFDTPGYDSQTRLYYRPVPGFKCPEIPKNPNRESVRAALDLINEAIGEFPYGDSSSAANTLGLMLTPIVRQAVNGPVPMALIDKPQAGTGGSLLAETIALIGTGRTAEMLGAPRDDEEWRKQITSKLAAGGTMITIDNVEGALFAPSLARALTARTWTDRILGRSETVTVSQRATWIATGNNIILRGDLPRRCYWIRLDARQSRPWQRENFRHPDLLSWVSKKRGELVGALLTIARAWFAANKPKATEVPRLGSFEAWTEIVGGIVTFAGIGGFLSNLKELYDKADQGNAEWEGFLEEWWRQRGEDPITVKDLHKFIEVEVSLKDALPGDLAEALDKGKGSFTRKLGNALAKRAGTRYGEEGLHIAEAGEFRRAKLWSVRDSSGECEFVSFVSLYNPSVSNFSSGESDSGGSDRQKQSDGGPETNSTNSQTHTEQGKTSDTKKTSRWLTEEEARQVQKLISEGMKPAFARAVVIGGEE